MSDNQPYKFHRRGLLALAGSVLFTGCSQFDRPAFGEQSTTLTGTDLRAIGMSEEPTIPETIPVDIDQAYLDEAETRARTLLSSVPLPLGPTEIPNGAIREELAQRREYAEQAIITADHAVAPFEAMRDLRRARKEAQALAAGWQAVDNGLTREQVADEAPAIREELDEFRDQWEYIGNNRIQAVVVHEAIEQLTIRANDNATKRTNLPHHEQETPVSIGALAGYLEHALAAIDDANHLFDRYRNALEDSENLREEINKAADTLVEIIEQRQGDLPSDDSIIPSNVDDDEFDMTPAGWALNDLHNDAVSTYRITENQSADHPASVILATHDTLAAIQAFESLRSQVANGESYTAESSEDVRAIRSEAIRAIETALTETQYPQLTRRLLSKYVTYYVQSADRELREVSHEIEADSLSHELSFYLRTTMVASNVLEAGNQVATVIQGSDVMR